ncbi:hypothetical protein D3C81_1837670 [compost metagenome]
MEISPVGNAEQVVDDHRGIPLTGQALLADQLFSSGLGLVAVIVGVEELHGCACRDFFGR